MRRSLRIGFVHPQLGVGGAERLVLDAASCLQQAGHRVTIVTSRLDRDHCFEHARDGTLDVRAYGDFLPLQVAGRLVAPCNIGRTCYAALRLALTRGRFDVIFADLVSQSIAVLRLMTRARIIFYCHFPDRLLAPQRGGFYRWYRAPIDWSERVTTGMAHLVLVNSRFTASVMARTFPRLGAPRLLYPGVEVAGPARNGDGADEDTVTMLSISRFDARKNLGLAIEALAALRPALAPTIFSRVRLVIAGGLDPLAAEPARTRNELEALARSRGVASQVVFRPSPDDGELRDLLSRCRCVVYTPEYEHFGYGPLEAMAASRAVVAVNNGGPPETIVDGITGFLCPPQPEAFATALAILVTDSARAERMGRAGRERVAGKFSKAAFGAQLEAIVEETVANSQSFPRG
jgi:alpha-1,3/alpha-1,6-mannosyltransferase